uniref:Cilia and flagella associated protein 65 n=1 Tax=Sphenodon punctatus TaxID=8508 RepID=A0A8D0LCE8_SPHPU
GRREIQVTPPPPDPLASKVKETKGTFWGIEVAESLHWQGWELGKELPKPLTLKNVHVKTQKLKFRPPATRFFVTVFPQPIVLSPGMSLTLPIIFRPLEKREYEDRIHFEKAEGEFSVVLRATPPCHSLLCPDSVQLPICAVYDSTEASFHLRNVGDLLTLFNWETPSPFQLIPASGMLGPGCECTIKVTFQPQAALVYDGIATCWFGGNEEQQRTINLRAIAKYPHLLVNVLGDGSDGAGPGNLQDVLCFGCVAVGSTVERSIEICNLSVVNAPLRIERAKALPLRDCVFSCDVTRAMVPASGKLIIPMRFSPQTVGVQSVDYFTVVPAGNITQSVLKLTGSCKGPAVSLQRSYVNFDRLNLGERSVQPLEITNGSDIPASFQFDIDSRESVFSFDVPCGVLGGRSALTLQVTFQPSHPIICYRRVVCLLHHQDPLFLDLFGTCHSDTIKPTILRGRHLGWYRTHVARGLTFYPPDILGTMLREGKLQSDGNGALRLPPQIPAGQPPEEYPALDPLTEYFHDGVSSDLAVFPPHVSLDVGEFDFGCCAKLREVEPLPVCLTNHTKGTVTVVWTRSPASPFRVTPESCDIPPLKSTALRVTFQPPQLNAPYAAELEAFAFYKVLRHYKSIEEDNTMCPSWCLTLRLQGHTFEAGRQHLVPRYILDCAKAFPAVCRHVTTSLSVLLRNSGTEPITFSLGLDRCPSILAKPRCGYITPGGHQIFLLSTCPADTAVQQQLLSLQLNSSPTYLQEIPLQSNAEPLLLLLEDGGSLYFKPTCVGASSARTFTIKNCTRLPMRFQWKIQLSDSKILAVRPAAGTIQPNEALAQAWTFTPGEETKYLLRACVTVWRAPQTPAPEPPENARYILRLIGQGALGTIQALKEQLDVGKVLVGSAQSCELVLLNEGLCSLHYVLGLEQSITGPCDSEEVAGDPLAIQLDSYKGVIPARGKAVVCVTVSPARQLHYAWPIHYTISTPKAVDPACALGEKQPLCRVTATGVYPSLCITDACGAGSAGGISKLHLWRLFSLETLNQYLERDPTPPELAFRVPTRHSTHRIPPVNTPVLLDFNFGAAPIGSEPSIVVLLLENNGEIPLNWAFLFPSDQTIDMEHWAESTEFDPSELHQMRVQDNQLFSVSPKAGMLLPGQEQAVQLSHRHDFTGTDRLPLLLKVSHGREILLNFIGVTVELGRRYVHFTSTRHMFAPIAIGTYSPPKQVFELYNGGSMSVAYEIQLEPLTRLQEENFQHPVFVCLNPRGEILPGLTAHIEWVFSPLEARTYSVDVPIHILRGDSALITFQGIGYDPHIMGECAQFGKALSPSVIPGSAKLAVLGQVAFLSQHRICLGNIPIYSKCSRLFFLNNASESEAILFAWRVGASNILPETGVVQPGESTHCILTLQASENPSFYNVDLTCEVRQGGPLAQYKKELREWEAEREQQAGEFVITEKDLAAERGARHLPKAPAAIRKYKTLPPIKNLHVPNPPASRSQRRQLVDKEGGRVWARPEPPKPFLLHLGVTARSQLIDDFLGSFYPEFPQHFLAERPDGMSPNRDERGVRTDLLQQALVSSSKQEQQLVMDVLSAVIRGLLEDTQFHEAVTWSLAEPVPYFFQFWSEESAKRVDRKQSLGGGASSSMDPSPDPGAGEGVGEEEELEEEESLTDIVLHEQIREQKDKISRLPAFANLVEHMLENTIQNILVEASRGEVVLTALPKVISLPPAACRR